MFIDYSEFTDNSVIAAMKAFESAVGVDATFEEFEAAQSAFQEATANSDADQVYAAEEALGF